MEACVEKHLHANTFVARRRSGSAPPLMLGTAQASAGVWLAMVYRSIMQLSVTIAAQENGITLY